MANNYDQIRILYKQVSDSEYQRLLYGHISFFRKNEDTAYRSEDPFIMRKERSSGELIYYGSLLLILQQMKRLIDVFLKKNQDFGETTESTSDPLRSRLKTLNVSAI